MNPAHRQGAYRVRLDWGAVGARACVAEGGAAVVVDVLSFTTTVSVAVERGMQVHPFEWNDQRAASYAESRDAVLAVGRSRAGAGDVSLSPLSVRAATGIARLVLPSPNGSTVSYGLASAGARVYAASLRNRASVAARISVIAGPLTVIAAGERWPDGSLRPCVEDLWGAGAVVAALVDLGVDGLSPEAEAAEAAFRAVEPTLASSMAGCASGRELAAIGFGDDVEVASELDVSDVVPVLRGEAFVAE